VSAILLKWDETEGESSTIQQAPQGVQGVRNRGIRTGGTNGEYRIQRQKERLCEVSEVLLLTAFKNGRHFAREVVGTIATQ
jgi:hypothetical protein